MSEKTAAKSDNPGKRELEGIGAYDPEGVEPITLMLGNLSKALGLLQVVQKEITSVKGNKVSPDGKLGGKGYIMTLRRFKDLISECVNNVSDLTDTLADELTNPRWGLEEDQLQSLLDQSEASKRDPEEPLIEEPLQEESTEALEKELLDEEVPVEVTEELEDLPPLEENEDAGLGEPEPQIGEEGNMKLPFRKLASKEPHMDALSRRVRAGISLGDRK